MCVLGWCWLFEAGDGTRMLQHGLLMICLPYTTRSAGQCTSMQSNCYCNYQTASNWLALLQGCKHVSILVVHRTLILQACDAAAAAGTVKQSQSIAQVNSSSAMPQITKPLPSTSHRLRFTAKAQQWTTRFMPLTCIPLHQQ
jgi:hypothetical protein